jgi:signal transduction histidine kinase
MNTPYEEREKLAINPEVKTPGVLLVDDENRNLDVLESILESLGLRFTRATTPENALLALVHGEFACIVLDIHMPTMSGLELARLIKTRKRNQSVPIIFLTAYFLEEKDILQGYGAGAVDYLTKPVNPQILKSKVSAFVDLYRSAHALAAVNNALELEVAQRKKAEEALRKVNGELEARVQDRVQELERAHDELVTASRAKDDFLAMLSHELRTPLNPVLLISSEGAKNHELPPRVRTDFATICKNVEVEARLIDDLLDLTRIARGKITLDKALIQAHSVMEDAIANVRDELNQKHIVLNLKLVAAWHLVFADAVRLQQIFLNLLKNAVKYTPEGGQITVTSSVTGNNLIIAVADTGIGLLPEEITNIFKAFSQVRKTSNGNTHRSEGLGLGLAISQKLAELHAGQIRVASEGHGKGSVFSIELPLAQAVGEGAPDSPPADSPPSGSPMIRNNIRILLVEDHEPTRTALTRLLMRRSYKVTTASSIAEARAMAEAGNFNLLVSDIGLPDGNGYDLMDELRKRFNLQGIALTGFGMEQDVARSQKAGFVVHLTKPIRADSLENALALALNGGHESKHFNEQTY